MSKKDESLLDLIRDAYYMLKDRSEQEAALIYYVAKMDTEERGAIILAYQNIEREKQDEMDKRQ